MIEHHIIPSKHYAYIEIKQTPDLATFIRASQLFVADPDFTPSLHRICDFSQADLSHITQKDFEAYLQFAVKEIPLEPGTKVALVAPSEAKAGIFRQFANNMGTGTFRVFYEPEQAVEWIHED
ncbi:MAG TPA: hypothetical protein VJ998_10335 [Pseudomonadales bacterium]|nr:hypothetical protein [Pseudomonadales bacterium]